jgi:hypothetical protein
MKAVIRRLRRLEDQFKPASSSRQGLEIVVARADRRLTVDGPACVQILPECGFVPSRCLSVVNLCEIPDGLNAAETERFLRENAAAICGA